MDHRKTPENNLEESEQSLSDSEISRLQSVYSKRDISGKPGKYAWYRPAAQYMEAIKHREFMLSIRNTIGTNLSNCKILDVGCGRGRFLRTLVEWGVRPENLYGTEIMADRIQDARVMSPSAMNYHADNLNMLSSNEYDIVCAHTVFSSLLDNESRARLANAMWERLRPGGWLMIFDFRYDNPDNKDVRKVKYSELSNYWSSQEKYYKTLILAPPIARRLPLNNYILPELLSFLFPFLRTHFIYMAKK